MLQEGRNHMVWLNIQETLLWAHGLMGRGVSLMQKQGKAASASLPSSFSRRYTGSILKPERTYCSQPTHHRPCDPDRALLRARVQGGRQWHTPAGHDKAVSCPLPLALVKALRPTLALPALTPGQGHIQTVQKHGQMPGNFGQVYRLAFLWLGSSLVVCLERSCRAAGRPQPWTMPLSQSSW